MSWECGWNFVDMVCVGCAEFGGQLVKDGHSWGSESEESRKHTKCFSVVSVSALLLAALNLTFCQLRWAKLM